MTPGGVFLAAELTAAETRYRRVLGRQMYTLGHADGWREGYEAAGLDMARRWAEIARPASRGEPSHAELERRRWGPGGRERFGAPRPGDFPGRKAARAD